MDKRYELYKLEYGEEGAKARMAEEARQDAIDAAELKREQRKQRDIDLKDLPRISMMTAKDYCEEVFGKRIIESAPAAKDEIPGKMPRTNIGKLAIKAAWHIECETGKQAMANQVINKLQAWVESEPELAEIIAHGVKWTTTKGKQKPFDVEACAKALVTWQASRA